MLLVPYYAEKTTSSQVSLVILKEENLPHEVTYHILPR